MPSRLYFRLYLIEFKKDWPNTKSWSFHLTIKIGCFVFSLLIATLRSSHSLRKRRLWPVWDISSSFWLCYFAKPSFSIIFLVKTLIFVPISKRGVTFEPFLSLTLAFEKLIIYSKWDFLALITFDSKELTQN